MPHLSPPIWEPAEKAIPDLLADVMYMSSVRYRPLVGRARWLHQYKHWATRRYIVLDDHGRAWRIVWRRPASWDVLAGRRISVRAAVKYMTGDTDWAQFLTPDQGEPVPPTPTPLHDNPPF